MRTLRLLLWSAGYLLNGIAPLSAQSPSEQLAELPLNPVHLTSNPLIPSVFFLPEGTLIPLEFATYASTQTAKPSDRVKFRVLADVRFEGLTVISKGAEAWGMVTMTKKPGHFGRNGRLQIELQSVTLLNGQAIPIRSPVVCKPCGKFSLRGPDSLQGPLLIPVALGIFAMMHREEQLTVLRSMVSKGDQEVRSPGMRMEGVVLHTVELNIDEFSNLRPDMRKQIP